MNDVALRESLQDLYEQAPCGYIFTSAAGSLVRVNETFLQWTGYSRDELESRRLQDLLTMAGRMFYENQYDPLLRMQGAVREVSFDLVCKDGTRLPVLLNSVVRPGVDGLPSLVASTIFSAVDRRGYERELLQARVRAEQLADVVTASIDAIIMCSVDGPVLSWNASAERLFGSAPDTLAALSLRDILPFSAVGYESTMQKLREGAPIHIDTVAVHSSGKSIDVSVSMTPHSDELGFITSVSAIIRDISERRALERLQQEFLAMASHELRTPLVVIQGHAQLMKRRGTYSERGMEAIISQTRQLARLIDDLLLASQIEADRFGVHLVELDLVSVLQSVVGSLASDRDDVVFRAPPHPVIILGDRHRLEQVVANLLTNAIKYSPEGGEVVLSIEVEVDRACLTVVDNGIGMPEEVIPRLFDRFYRGPDVVEVTKGAGLGLYITRTIVEAHGGTIGVESEVGRGSTFTLTFPVVSASSK